MKRGKILPLSAAELEALPTQRLLARLKRLQECEESLDLSDRGPDEERGGIEFKQTDAWREAHWQLKQILAQREHLPKGRERLEMRKLRAHQAKHPGRHRSA